MINNEKHIIQIRILSLTKEVDHIQKAIILMRKANLELKNKKSFNLKKLGFTADHIKDLIKKFNLSGKAFPDYTIENNQQIIFFLQMEITKLNRKMEKICKNISTKHDEYEKVILTKIS